MSSTNQPKRSGAASKRPATSASKGKAHVVGMKPAAPRRRLRKPHATHEAAVGKQMSEAPKGFTANKFWEDLLGGIGQGIELGSKLAGMFGHKPGGTASISGRRGSGWIGTVKPNTVRGSGAPHIRQVSTSVYEITHQGELTELLKQDDAGSDYARGDCMYSIALNPNVEEWLGSFSKFEKYRFLDVAVTYEPAVSTDCAGKLIGYYDDDVDNPTLGGGGEETIRRAMAYDTAAMVDVWTPHTWVRSFKQNAQSWYYCGTTEHEARTAYQGRFSLIAGADMTDDSLPTSIGDLIITYRVELTVPNLNNGAIAGQSVTYEGTGVATHPFSTSFKAVDLFDTAVNPDYQLPHCFDVDLTDDNGFELPPGYYLSTFTVNGVSLAGGPHFVLNGGTRLLYHGAQKNAGWVAGTVSTTSITGYAAFCVPTEGSGFFWNIDSGTVVSAYLTVTCLGGSVPYVSMLETLRARDSQGKTKLRWLCPESRGRSTLAKKTKVRQPRQVPTVVHDDSCATPKVTTSSSSSTSATVPLTLIDDVKGLDVTKLTRAGLAFYVDHATLGRDEFVKAFQAKHPGLSPYTDPDKTR